jgi:uncharacterized damage-inducible protein DinB
MPALYCARFTTALDGYNVKMIRTEQVLDSWKAIREDTAQAVLDFAAEDFSFRATPEMQTFGEIAFHTLQAGNCLTGMLLAGEEDFTVPDFRERMARHAAPVPAGASPAELAAALRETLERRVQELSKQSPEFFAGIITRFDGQRLTRLEMVQAIKEHELTHRAQLFMYLRLKGIVPSTTRRRLAKQAGK